MAKKDRKIKITAAMIRAGEEVCDDANVPDEGLVDYMSLATLAKKIYIAMEKAKIIGE